MFLFILKKEKILYVSLQGDSKVFPFFELVLLGLYPFCNAQMTKYNIKCSKFSDDTRKNSLFYFFILFDFLFHGYVLF